jgi:aminopeptidase N
MSKPTLTHALVLIAISTLWACKSSKIATEQTQYLEDVVVEPKIPMEYRASRTKEINILHTRLDLAFDWDSSFVIGKARLWIKPHFYPIQELKLDAKGFQLNQVAEKRGEDLVDLKFEYDRKQIIIKLTDELKSSDSIEIYIDYIAMPDKLELGGSAAITSDKGLYFINPRNEDPKKPRQLWTQGETESNSCWFPTVDSPNDKFTTDIYLTIESNQVAISNGVQLFSIDNGDGTKSEHWKMDQPHSAYLVMLAIGEFSVYEDKWNGMQVNYYLDSAYLKYAHDIFGNTPEMLEFYSDYLGVKYPWPKFDQIIVHDYVSGAMENTTAVIHGEFVQQTRRELIDHDNEDVISHELFHHWFGDLITCESWSNLTLNEGFATYGEYLWEEYKYGRSDADQHIRYDLLSYLNEARYSQKDLIRFTYNDKEDMFDSHSYAKGGRILHMLRNEVGDEAFRQSLKKFLSDHAYQSVEVHDLRLAFEEVTGRDLNWFFNQWFLASGHPILDVSYRYNDEIGELELIVEQNQDLTKTPLYTLSVDLEIQLSSSLISKRISLSKLKDTVRIPTGENPVFVNFDRGEVVLAEKNVQQTNQAWMEQYRSSILDIDRNKALLALKEEKSESIYSFFKEALADKFWVGRSIALDYITEYLAEHEDPTVKSALYTMAENEPDIMTRTGAIECLKVNFQDVSLKELYRKGLQDSSYSVMAISFKALYDLDKEEGMSVADMMEAAGNKKMILSLADLYAQMGDESKNSFFINSFDELSAYEKLELVLFYGEYLANQNDSVMLIALPFLKKCSIEEEAWWVRMSGIIVSMKVNARFKKEVNDSEKVLKAMKSTNPNYAIQNDQVEKSKLAFTEVDALWKEITDKESNEKLQSIIREYNENGTSPFLER